MHNYYIYVQDNPGERFPAVVIDKNGKEYLMMCKKERIVGLVRHPDKARAFTMCVKLAIGRSFMPWGKWAATVAKYPLNYSLVENPPYKLSTLPATEISQSEYDRLSRGCKHIEIQ